MHRLLRLGPGLLALGACKPPPQAPAALEDLCGYIFLHMGDDLEDDEALIAGVQNLDRWLGQGDHLAATVEGYQITNLDQEAVRALNLRNSRSVDALIGAAVATEHPYGMRPVVHTTVVADWSEVVPANYVEYDRDFERDPSCFPGRDCLALEASSYGLAKFAGLIDVETWNDIEYRWVDTEIGWAMVHRSWLTRPAEVSLNGMDVFAQYFLSVSLPAGSGRTTRVQATWIDADYGVLPVSEDFAKSQIVTSMQKQGEAVNDYLEN